MKVEIIMGSDSDLPVMKEAADFLDCMGIPYEISIVSAHRTPKMLYQCAETAKARGIWVIIAGAGGSAHLPGMVASITTLPVIGVPIKTKALNGVDSLYSIVQMPDGIPVATVSINGAKNAGILAASILSVFNDEIAEKLRLHKDGMGLAVCEKSEKLKKQGAKAYLEQLNGGS
ncbi:MAG: 5-(carboxyamino)imidazole ribonucleotide mutase [Oscillospiraceae bacterium]|nr:5-(carboxyamino)imidazole ribonucleotide mutase [Oscillospiraceae bacterium]